MQLTSVTYSLTVYVSYYHFITNYFNPLTLLVGHW